MLTNRLITHLQQQKSQQIPVKEKHGSSHGEQNEKKNCHKAFFFLRQFGDKIADTISASNVVSIADCHPGDRGLIPRQRENF